MLNVGDVIPNTLMNWRVSSINDNGKMVVKHEASGRIYGHLTKDSLYEIRKKFSVIFFTQIITGVVFRLPYKILNLLSCDFASRGYIIAERNWKHIQFEDKQKNDSKTRYLAPRIIGCVMIELAKDIAKISTYPLALIGLQFLALFTIIDPLDGRKLYSDLEALYATGYKETLNRNILAWTGPGPRSNLTNFSMPCAQPKDVFQSRNLYMHMHYWHPDTLNSLILEAKNAIETESIYFGETKEKLFSLFQELKLRTLPHMKEIELRENSEPTYCRAAQFNILESVNTKEKAAMKEVMTKLKNHIKDPHQSAEKVFDDVKQIINNSFHL